MSSDVDQDQKCQVTLEATTKSGKTLKTKPFTVELKKRTLEVDWDASGAKLVYGGPTEVYLGTFDINSNSQFPIERNIVESSADCSLELDGKNLHGYYKGPDQVSKCQISVEFKTKDGRFKTTKSVDIPIEKANLLFSLGHRIGQLPASSSPPI